MYVGLETLFPISCLRVLQKLVGKIVQTWKGTREADSMEGTGTTCEGRGR